MRLSILFEQEDLLANPLDDKVTRRGMLSALVNLDAQLHDLDKAIKARKQGWVVNTASKIEPNLQQLNNYVQKLSGAQSQAQSQQSQQSQQVQISQPAQTQPQPNQAQPAEPKRKSEQQWLNNARVKVAKTDPNERQKLIGQLVNKYVEMGGKKDQKLIYRFLAAGV